MLIVPLLGKEIWRLFCPRLGSVPVIFTTNSPCPLLGTVIEAADRPGAFDSIKKRDGLSP